MPSPNRAGRRSPSPPATGRPAPPTAVGPDRPPASTAQVAQAPARPAVRVGAPSSGPAGNPPARRFATADGSLREAAAGVQGLPPGATDAGIAATAATSSRPRTPDLQQAAYVLARQVTGRPLSAPTQALMQRANESRKEVLALMPYGRSNVTTDLEATQRQGFHRLLAQRHVMGNISSLGDPPALTHARDAALSAYAGSGNCGEFANVAAHVHARRLQEGERLTVQKAHDFDHSWVTVEGRASPGGTVPRAVLDVWADGPVVAPADDRFIAGAAQPPLTLHCITHAEAELARQRFDALRQDPGARTIRQIEGLTQAHARNDRQPTGTVYAPMPVVSDAFCTAVRSALATQGHDAALRQTATGLAAELAGASAEHQAAAADRILDLAAHLDRAQARRLDAPGHKRRRTSPDPD